MRILELSHFSSGACGVWVRAFEEGKRLVEKGHEVVVFSSDRDKGSDKKISKSEIKEGVKIKRFPSMHLGGESFLYWDFEKEALRYSPDVIVAHNYRQYPTHLALKVARKLRKLGKKCVVFLVTHAPFPEGSVTRSFIEKNIVGVYDKFVGPRTLNKFDKIFPISHWEVPHLLRCGAEKERIFYVPNGIPEEFFTQEQVKEENKILFLGRVAPKKKLETLIEAMSLLKDKDVKLEIVGPEEKEYASMLKNLVRKFNVQERVKFLPGIYDIGEKIRKLDSAKLYVLPSRVEGMPQSLIEAMARGKVVIGSNSVAIRDLIENGKTGYLFEFDNPQSLASVIDSALSSGKKEVGETAKRFAEQFDWKNVIVKIDKLISS